MARHGWMAVVGLLVVGTAGEARAVACECIPSDDRCAEFYEDPSWYCDAIGGDCGFCTQQANDCECTADEQCAAAYNDPSYVCGGCTCTNQCGDAYRCDTNDDCAGIGDLICQFDVERGCRICVASCGDGCVPGESCQSEAVCQPSTEEGCWACEFDGPVPCECTTSVDCPQGEICDGCACVDECNCERDFDCRDLGEGFYCVINGECGRCDEKDGPEPEPSDEPEPDEGEPDAMVGPLGCGCESASKPPTKAAGAWAALAALWLARRRRAR